MRDGWYGARENQRRQRWRCTPADGSKDHRFSEVLPRLAAPKHGSHYCPDCETKLEAWEGHPAPRLYGFAAREVAGALAAVAGGATYRDAAARARSKAGRQLATQRRTRIAAGKAKPVQVAEANRHPQLVSDWVQTYAPVLWEYYLGKRLKAGVGPSVMLDAARMVTTRRGASGGTTAFHVLAVVAYGSDGKPFVAAVAAAPSETRDEWVRLLTSLPFTPSRFVADRGGRADVAAGQVWPEAVGYACEWHLRKNLTAQLPMGLPGDHLARRFVAGAMADLDTWDWVGAWLRAEQSIDRRWTNVVTTYDRMDAMVRVQLVSRPPEGPNGTGPVEQFLEMLKKTLAGRAGSMTNRTRADAMLLLLAAGPNRWVDEQRWAYLLRGWLVKRDGVAPAQRPSDDPEGVPSLRTYVRQARPQTQGQEGVSKPRVAPAATLEQLDEPATSRDPWQMPPPTWPASSLVGEPDPWQLPAPA